MTIIIWLNLLGSIRSFMLYADSHNSPNTKSWETGKGIIITSFLIAAEMYNQDVNGDFPGSPLVKTPPSKVGGEGLVPGLGNKIPHASQPKIQNIKQKQQCNKFNEDFKNALHLKKIFKTENK